MFSGTTNHSIDTKGRIILPQKFRDELGEEFYITSGFADNIQIMSVDEFNHLRAQIKELPADKALALQYLLLSAATLVSPNAQGRVQIPQKLREDSGIEGTAVVVGMDTRIEVWNKDKFEEFMALQKQKFIGDALELLRF
ncbi:MAG: division/cell wall cluster transcriptional repressor MraZ [Oscillospiraceae bacterium]|nr:division/cell wall cluster transcriptional repressor MraZ [Oscillospiraceae bacterium]